MTLTILYTSLFLDEKTCDKYIFLIFYISLVAIYWLLLQKNSFSDEYLIISKTEYWLSKGGENTLAEMRMVFFIF